MWPRVMHLLWTKSGCDFDGTSSATWHSIPLHPNVVVDVLRIITTCRRNLLYSPLVDVTTFKFNEDWLGKAEKMWHDHVRSTFPTVSVDPVQCRAFVQGCWDVLCGDGKERQKRSRSTSVLIVEELRSLRAVIGSAPSPQVALKVPVTPQQKAPPQPAPPAPPAASKGTKSLVAPGP
eukprot:PhM_4_TR14234/c0_g1_i4/m.12485